MHDDLRHNPMHVTMMQPLKAIRDPHVHHLHHLARRPRPPGRVRLWAAGLLARAADRLASEPAPALERRA